MFRSARAIAAAGLLAVLASCSGSEPSSKGRADPPADDVAAAASDPSLAPPDPGMTPPGLNPVEAEVVDALDALGIDGQRAEYNTFGASIRGEFEGGGAVYVSAYPAAASPAESSVFNERVVGGIVVQHIEYSTGPIRDRFECGDLTYEVEGATPPGFDDFEWFLGGLIDALGCAPSGTES